MAEKNICPLCEEKLGFFYRGFWSINAPKLLDSAVCEDCHRQLCRLLQFKKHWIPKDQVNQNPWRLMKWEHTEEISVTDAKALFDLRDQLCAAAGQSLGVSSGNTFVSVQSFRLTPHPPVAIHRVKKLSLKAAVGGLVLRGSFKKGDTVTLLHQGEILQREIIELAPCKNGAFKSNECYSMLESNVHKQELKAGDEGWLLLDLDGITPDGGVFLMG